MNRPTARKSTGSIQSRRARTTTTSMSHQRSSSGHDDDEDIQYLGIVEPQIRQPANLESSTSSNHETQQANQPTVSDPVDVDLHFDIDETRSEELRALLRRDYEDRVTEGERTSRRRTKSSGKYKLAGLEFCPSCRVWRRRMSALTCGHQICTWCENKEYKCGRRNCR